MAEPTEPRVNKAFVVPDSDRPAIDPGASDVTDQSYERIEQLRAERALAGETSQANAQRIAEDEKLLNATGASEDRSYDRIEELRAAADTSATDYQASMAAGRGGSLAANPADTSYERIEALRGERAAGDDATPTQTVDTPPSGRDLMTGTEDPGVIESARLDRWELDQADLAKSTAGEDRSYDRIEELRVERAAAGDATPRPDRWELDQADATKAIDNYDAGQDLHAEHSAEIHASHGMDVPAAPDDAPQIQDGFTPD